MVSACLLPAQSWRWFCWGETGPGGARVEPGRSGRGQSGRGGAGPGGWTHRGVLAQLAEGREGLLMGLADLLDDGLQLGRELVALRQLRLRAFLLLLVAVVSDGWRTKTRMSRSS